MNAFRFPARPRFTARRARAPFVCTAGILAFGAAASAANITWDGGDAANNSGWMNPLNWVGDAAPFDFDSLIFDGTAGLTNTNDFAAESFFGGITFAATAGDFTLQGNSINLAGNITNLKTSGTQTIDLGITLGTISTMRVAAGGTLRVNGLITGSSGLTKTGAGTLLLTSALNDFTGTISINGGVLSLGTTGSLLGAPALIHGNGELSITGDAAAARDVALGTLNLTTGRNILSLAANPAHHATLTFSEVTVRAVGGTALYRGTNLGTTAPGTSGAANILFATAPTPNVGATGYSGAFAALGTGTLGTTQAAVLRGALVDTSATGNGAAFATYDATNGVRALNPATEQTTGYAAAVAGDNVLLNLTGATSITGKQTNTLQVNNTSGGALTLTNSGNALWPSNGLLFTGNSATTLTGGSLSFPNNSGVNNDMIILSTNTATVTIATGLASSGLNQRSYVLGGPGNFIITTSNVGSSGAGGNYFNGPGTVTLRTSGYGASSAGTVVNGGTVILGTGFAHAGNNTRPLAVAAGGTFDINNYAYPSTATSGVDAINNTLNGLGGTVTNSGGTLTNFTLSLNNGQGDFNGVVSGNLNLILNKQGTTGTQTQKFTNALTYAGSTTVTASSATVTTAFLTLGAGGNLPSGTALTLGGTPGAATGSGVLTLGDVNGPVNQTVASLATSGNGTANAVAGGTFSGVSTLTVNGSASTIFAGTLGGIGAAENLALVRTGTGSLTLTAENLYIGGTTISGGTLKVNNATGSGTGTGAVSVLSGGTLGGNGVITGQVSVASGGHLAPGASVGTLTVGTVTLSTGAILDWEFNSAPANDRLVITDTDGFTLNGGGFNLFQENSATAFDALGTYNLFQFAGTVQGAGIGALSVLNPQFGRNYSFGVSGNLITLTIASTNVVANWALATGGSWGAGASWDSNPTIPNLIGATANLGTAITAPAMITLDEAQTVGTLTFNNANAYTVAAGAGGSLTLNNGASNGSISVSTGSHAITAPLTLTSANNTGSVGNAADTLTISGAIGGAGALTKTGNGTLVLSGTNAYTGGTTLSGGVTQISSDANLGAAAGGLVIGNATLQTQGTFTSARNLQLGSAGSTFLVDNADTLQLDGSISDGASAGTLNKNGTGTLVLNGAGTFTGGAAINAGTVQVGTGGASGSLGSGPVTNNGTLIINGTGARTVGALSGTGALQILGGGSVLLAGAGGTYSGPVNVTGSTLNLGASDAAGTGALTLDGATLTQNNVSTTISNPLSVLNTLTIDTAGANSLVLAGNLSGNAAITRSGGTGSLTFGGINSPTFAGTFTNTSGNVIFTRREAGSTAAQWFFNAGAVTLNNMGGTINFGLLSGSANITTAGNVARVRVGDLGLSSTYSGSFTGGPNGMGLFKTGGGTFTLTGQNAGFTNDAITALLGFNTVVGNGTLIAGSSTTGTVSGPFGGSGSTVLLGSNGTLTNANLRIGGAFNVANPITVSGGSVASSGYTLTLGGNTDSASTFSGPIVLQTDLTITQAATTGSNALHITGGISGTAAGTGLNNAGTPITSPNNTGTQIVTFAGPGAVEVSGTPIADGAGIVGVKVTDGTVTFSTSNSYTGPTDVLGGTLITTVSQTMSALNIGDGATVILAAAPPAPAPTGVDADLIEPGFSDPSAGASVQAVPEPSTLGLLALGVLSMLRRRRRGT